MTDLDRDIKQFLLKVLLAANSEPMTDGSLKGAVITTWRHLAFSNETLDSYLADLVVNKFIVSTRDPVAGLVWALTLKGKTTAQQLR